MSREVNRIIKNSMNSLGIEYGFGEYSKTPIAYPYFVGEYQEAEGFTEDGLQESTFLLTGFSRGSWEELEAAREKIEKKFNRVSGKIGITESGSAVAVFYSHSMIVPTNDAELKSVQVNLSIKEWKVN